MPALQATQEGGFEAKIAVCESIRAYVSKILMYAFVGEERTTNDNAKGGWHMAKGSKGIGKGKDRQAGSESTNEAIHRLLALKLK